jgi:predicted RNase H-like HicB family nuclease
MKLKAIIEKDVNGEYSIYVPDFQHALMGYGKTEAEAKECLRDGIDDIVACCKDEGVDDGMSGGNVEFEYEYDSSCFPAAAVRQSYA